MLVIDPPFEPIVTAPTVSEWLPSAKVPPLTVRAELLDITSLAPKAKVPADTVVVPV